MSVGWEVEVFEYVGLVGFELMLFVVVRFVMGVL